MKKPQKSKGQITITLEVPVENAAVAALFANLVWDWFSSIPPYDGTIEVVYDPSASFKPASGDGKPWTAKNIQ
jgi:hypothetical protein